MRQAIISTAMLMIASVPAESRSALRFGACPKPYFFPRSFESAALPRSFQKVSSTFFLAEGSLLWASGGKSSGVSVSFSSKSRAFRGQEESFSGSFTHKRIQIQRLGEHVEATV